MIQHLDEGSIVLLPEKQQVYLTCCCGQNIARGEVKNAAFFVHAPILHSNDSNGRVWGFTGRCCSCKKVIVVDMQYVAALLTLKYPEFKELAQTLCLELIWLLTCYQILYEKKRALNSRRMISKLPSPALIYQARAFEREEELAFLRQYIRDAWKKAGSETSPHDD